MNKEEISLGGNYLNIKAAKLVTLNQVLYLSDTKETISLDIKIEADFSTIPNKYHEVFLNMMTSKYYGKVSFGDNPFSQCVPAPKKRWYQFWK